MKTGSVSIIGALLIVGGIFAGGCSSVVTHTEFHGQKLTETGAEQVAHIHSDIWGIYFLGFQSCPVITGSYKNPGGFRLFRDTVTPGTAADMVAVKSRDLGADTVINLKTDWESGWQAYTLIFWLKEAQASGTALVGLPEEAAAETPAAVPEESP